ncbi:hypothetical protein DUI87_24994 [Hirundo rustica rustica]|uniref:Uncharacterized protein n=1 Tax=Hirundo rustica rustica TaxID=333673 RepID=A0A3M0JCS6_HIRRU|nr:hypothetical protein DUI87_24994 [Hirundo rustica rustica]
MAGQEWDWFQREELIGHISDIRVQNLQGPKELGGIERKTEEELAEGMDEAYLSCVNVGKYLLKDVYLPWVIIGMNMFCKRKKSES